MKKGDYFYVKDISFASSFRCFGTPDFDPPELRGREETRKTLHRATCGIQIMPDLGRSTRESGEARLAFWRVSPSHATLV